MTKIRINFYRDPAGDPRAQCDPPYEVLARFLEGDIQGNSAFCRDIIKAIDQVTAGERKSWQMTGNAHTLILKRKEARIEAEFDDNAKPCLLSLEELRQTIADWLAFIDAK